MDYNEAIEQLQNPNDIRHIVEQLIRDFNRGVIIESTFVHHIQSLIMKSMEIGARSIVNDMVGFNTQLKFRVKQTPIQIRNGYELAVRDANIQFHKKFGGSHGRNTPKGGDKKNRNNGITGSDEGVKDDLPW